MLVNINTYVAVSSTSDSISGNEVDRETSIDCGGRHVTRIAEQEVPYFTLQYYVHML